MSYDAPTYFCILHSDLTATSIERRAKGSLNNRNLPARSSVRRRYCFQALPHDTITITSSLQDRGARPRNIHTPLHALLSRVRDMHANCRRNRLRERTRARTGVEAIIRTYVSVNFAENRTGTESTGVEFSWCCRFHGKRVRREEVLEVPVARTSGPLTPPGTRRARRDGEKVAALSKRRCSRVDDSRGTTLRERHSGVEHAAAPFSPRDCACVHPRLPVWVAVRVYVGSACVCARATSSHSSVVYQTVSPPPPERAATLLPRCLSRAHPPFFLLLPHLLLLLLVFLILLLLLVPPLLVPLSTSFLISTLLLRSPFFLFFPAAPGKIAAPVR